MHCIVINDEFVFCLSSVSKQKFTEFRARERGVHGIFCLSLFLQKKWKKSIAAVVVWGWEYNKSVIEFLLVVHVNHSETHMHSLISIYRVNGFISPQLGFQKRLAVFRAYQLGNYELWTTPTSWNIAPGNLSTGKVLSVDFPSENFTSSTIISWKVTPLVEFPPENSRPRKIALRRINPSYYLQFIFKIHHNTLNSLQAIW